MLVVGTPGVQVLDASSGHTRVTPVLPRAAYPLTVALGIEPRDLAKGRELSFHHSRSKLSQVTSSNEKRSETRRATRVL